MAQQFDVAVLGATGLVGQHLIEILEQRDFPVKRLIPLASSRSAGGFVTFKGKQIEVLDAETFDWTRSPDRFVFRWRQRFCLVCTKGGRRWLCGD